MYDEVCVKSIVFRIESLKKLAENLQGNKIRLFLPDQLMIMHTLYTNLFYYIVSVQSDDPIY